MENETITEFIITQLSALALQNVHIVDAVIRKLEGGVDREDPLHSVLVASGQCSLNQASSMLGELNNIQDIIAPNVLEEFNALNDSIRQLNAANNEVLIQPREIGEMPPDHGIEDYYAFCQLQVAAEYEDHGIEDSYAFNQLQVAGRYEDHEDEDGGGCCCVVM